MKAFSILALTLLVGTSAFAQRHSTNAPGVVHTSNDFSTSMRGNAVTGYLGFGQGAVNIGADFEATTSTETGFGGYFLLATDKKDAGRSQVIAFGADAKVHYRPGPFDFYAAPGFGIALVDVAATDKQSTTFGPSMRLGVLYSLTPTVSAGIEQATLFNWFSKDAPEVMMTSLAAFRFNF